MQRQSVMPDTSTYSALINGFEKGSQPDQALHVFQAMCWQGVVPSKLSYSALISACEKGNKPE